MPDGARDAREAAAPATMKQNAMQKWEEQQRLKLMSKKIASAKSVLRCGPAQHARAARPTAPRPRPRPPCARCTVTPRACRAWARR